jgi:hypothetical protein
MFNTRLSFMFFSVLLNGWKKFATLLPNNWLAETPQTLALMRLGRQCRKGSGFLKSTALEIKKLCPPSMELETQANFWF